MILLLMRHGDAEFTAQGGDRNRRLTEHGRGQATSMGQLIARSGIPIDCIVHSPYARALETADIVRRVLGENIAHHVASELAPDCTMSQMRAVAQSFRDKGNLLLIAHMPTIGAFAGSLVAPNTHLPMSPAAIAALRVNLGNSDPRGELLWFVTPEVVGM